MLASAHLLHDQIHADALGVRFEGGASADFRRIMERKDRVVARFKRAKIQSIEASGYEVLLGRARFAEGGGVELNGRRLTARGYVIATGSVPVSLPIPGIDEVPILTSDDVMDLTELPKRLLATARTSHRFPSVRILPWRSSPRRETSIARSPIWRDTRSFTSPD